jgi:circadian clock protein KaiC
MGKMKKKNPENPSLFPKTPSGINGLDEITFGGLPSGRCALVCGGPGCGKTLMALEFLVRGARDYGEPGVFIAFEETAEEIKANVLSLGFNLDELIKKNLLRIDYIKVNRIEIEETGEYDLEGLFIRLGYALDAINAKRLAIDTIESLFSGFDNHAILRAELLRLFHWIKERKVTTIITGERGDGSLTRQGLEEYVSDCVITLDHRIKNQVSTRRLRIVKYRGSFHGTNEYPFIIEEKGITVLPITSLKLDHSVSKNIISTGIPEMDEMLGKKGYYEGSTIMISGTAGTAKTILSAFFTQELCRNNKKVSYFAFEESPKQLIRNMASVGIKLEKCVKNGLLQIHSSRPTLYGLEMHLIKMYKLIKIFHPSAIIVDPMTDLISIGSSLEVRNMLTRLIDMLKTEGITALFTSLTKHESQNNIGLTEEGVSSLIDTWVHLRDIEVDGEKKRGISIIKSRGMNHSSKIREFQITNHGIKIMDDINLKNQQNEYANNR